MSRTMHGATAMPQGTIFTSDVSAFRAYIKPGVKLRCREFDFVDGGAGALEKESICRVIKKYPWCCLTTRGCFGWNMLTIWNRDILQEIRRWA